MVKHIILVGDDENKLNQAKNQVKEFVEQVGWNCDVKECMDCEVNSLTISSQGKIIRINTDKIRCIESHNHRVYIYTDKEKYTVYEKLSDILQRLPESFIQCHKSFLVNLEYVEALEGKEIILIEGRRISISRTYYNQTKDKIMEYI